LASEAECAQAFRTLADLLDTVDPEVRNKYAIERTVSCRITDLGVTWSARVCEDGIEDLTTEDGSKAQVRLTVASDDLLALVAGRLAVPTAFATGKLRVQASPFDLLRLGSFL
jgi:putative sterol carrier protein